MTRFIFATQKELKKLLYKKKYIVLIVLGAIVSLARWGGSALITRFTDGVIVTKTNMILEMLPFAIEVLVPIIMFMAASDLFTHEYSNDTLKSSLLQPVSRFKLLTAKTAAILIHGTIALFIMYIVNTLIQVISGGSLSGAFVAFAAYLIDVIPLIGVAFWGVFINTALKSPTTATLLSISVYAVMKYMGLYVAGSESFLFTSGAKLHIMLLGAALPFHVLMYKFGILFGSILILYSVSYIMFDKKNI